MLSAWRTPKLSSRHPVYELRKRLWPPLRRTRELHWRQVELLRATRLLPWKTYLACDEDPHEWELTGPWIHAGAHTWIIPHQQSSESLLEGYLAAGGWTVYLAPYALQGANVPSLFDAPEEVCEYLRSHGVPVMIQAFHDNSEWRVALEPAVVPAMAAA